mmetsp:Transcript_1172/g.1708  ORF Transcript_1172/g.1708 Transcript_1172/m.1708 type:complete len:168 (+) Transcript_1172:104-607(+)
MRKRLASFRKLSRSPSHKWAMLRNMVTSLIQHERIETTLAKAKELRHLADRMVTHAKHGSLHHRRLANGVIREQHVLVKLFDVLGPRYSDREGGYTRVLKLSKQRKGDNAPMAVIEYVDRPGEVRAARPPQSRRQLDNLRRVLLEPIGIEPIMEEQGNDNNNNASLK